MIKGISFKNLRILLGINQTDLSEYLGITRSHENMIESYHRSIPDEVYRRMVWTEEQMGKNLQSFENLKNKQVLTNKGSVDFAWAELKKKQYDIKTLEMQLEVLMRENVGHYQRAYLFENLQPMPDLKIKALRVFEAWKAYHARVAMQKLEKAGPEAILRQQMKIAAMKAEIECLQAHLAISPVQAKPKSVK
jgi:transcriptional regulator with XRE-family HTH domain